MNLPQIIENFMTQPNIEGSEILLALSGGIDSVVLLELLVNSSFANDKIRVIYVDHGLSANAQQWGDFCRTLCDKHQVNFNIESVTLNDRSRNIEAMAREARYLALKSHVKAQTILVTAQHSDDQTETLLLALKRGSGSLGLAGMPISLNFGLGKHCRPLLSASRQAIELYAKQHQLSWIEDESNDDSRFDRNYLRHQIIPQLNQRWPGFAHNVARSAQLLNQANELLDELAQIDLTKAGINPDGLSVSYLQTLSLARRNNVIRFWLRQLNLQLPSQAQLQQIEQQMIDGALDSSPIVTIGDYQIRRYQGIMLVVAPQQDISSQVILWQGQSQIELPDGLGQLSFCIGETATESTLSVCLVAPKDQKVEIKFEVAGSEKAWPIGRDKRRSVKKLWQEYAVPPWLRQRIPLIFFDQQLVAALGVWVEQGYQGHDNNTDNLVISWHKSPITQ